MPPSVQRGSLLTYLDDFRARGNQIACVHRRGYRTERWSYARLAATAAQFARELESRQVGEGDPVLLWGPNCAEWVAAFWGCLYRKAIVVPMDQTSAPDFVARVMQQVRPRLLVRGRELPAPPGSPPALILEDLAATVQARNKNPFPRPPVSRDHTAEIIFTSGTTAEPRGVVLTHGNILANIEPVEREMAKYIKYERPFHPIRFLDLLPLSHVFGQFFGLFIPPLMSGTVLFQPTLSPADILKTIKRERVSVLGAVPRIMDSLKRALERDAEAAGRLGMLRRDIDTAKGIHVLRKLWRFRAVHRRLGWKFWAFVCGGATLDPETERFWQRQGYAVIQGYGLTETTSMVSINHPFKLSHGSIGQVLPGRELKLGDDGEILVRGAGVAGGYWSEGKLEVAGGDEGWFPTGDIGALDEKGNLFFKGRKKSVIVTSEGMNIYPEDLEAALRRQPGITDCIVVETNRNGSPEPCAVIVPADSGADIGTAVERANRELAAYQTIRDHRVWPEPDFPRTASGKPSLGLIRAWVSAGTGSRTADDVRPAPGSLSELIGKVQGTGGGASSGKANLEDDLNLTSLDRVELLSALEDRYQTEINEADFAAAKTVGDVDRLLHQTASTATRFHYPRWAQRAPVRWIRVAVYYLLSWPATVLLGLPEVRGRENLRGVRGAVLVISNHTVSADIGFILWALPPRLRHRLAVAMDGERLEAMRNPPPSAGFFRRQLSRVNYFLATALFNVFPLPQRSGFRESFSFAGETADRGCNILVFPEGRRTPDGKMHPFRSGIGILAERLNIPVVPMRIDGLFELKKAKRRRARPYQIKVTVGEPVRFPSGADPERITEELESRVRALADSEN